MKWPFITREHHEETLRLHEERQADALKVRDERIAQLEEERKKLTDWIVKGMSGMSIYEKPPIAIEEPEPAAPKDPNKALTEQIPDAITRAQLEFGRDARKIVRNIERENDEDFEHLRPVLNLLDDTIRDGEREALKTA